MKYFSALVLLMSLAAASATDDKKPDPPKTPPTTPTTPTTPSGPGGPKDPIKPGGGKGDPIMTGLDGRSFEFFGKVGSIYNVLSEKNHQVTMKLKEGNMWDHEGTYMSAVGFRYLEHTVELANVGDEMEVTLDGEKLSMRASQSEQEVILGLAQGELSLLWQLHRADFGNAVEITTDMLKFVCWVTPAGTRDEGGKVQPAYLNFDLTLLATPAHNALEGIIGETYASAISSSKTTENDFKFHGVDAEYEVPSLFETTHAKSVFGKAHAGGKARKLIEAATFPMHASLSL